MAGETSATPANREAPDATRPVEALPLTSFIGRSREITRVTELLRNDDVRLLTLTGPGGIGKTRLAWRVADSVTDDFLDGVVFVPLAPVHDAALVVPAIAEAVGAREAGERQLADVLNDAVGTRRMLLILDNFEHVVAATPQVTALLASCPNLKLLVTSRAVLRASAEYELQVPALTLPTEVDPAQAESVQLFVARAQALDPEFVLDDATAGDVIAICARLEGLPLAIELAAARLRHLPLAALAARLDQQLPLLSSGARDAPIRLQTMRDAIGWSYDLLHPEQQRLLRHLSVFTGSFTLDAAPHVSGSDDDLLVLEGITALLDNSLLYRHTGEQEPRYAMLESIREFGLERLVANGEIEAVRERHAEWYLALAVEAWPVFKSRAGQEVWLTRFELEHDNFRVALSWLDEQGRGGEMVRLTARLWWFWYVQGHFSEGVAWLTRALALSAAEADVTPDRTLTTFGAGTLAHYQGDDEQAELLLRAALSQWQQQGDEWGTAVARHLLANTAVDHGRYDEAVPLLEAAVLGFQRTAAPANEALSLYQLGVARWGQGDMDQATQLCNAALELHRAAGDRLGEAYARNYLGLFAGLNGDHELAAAHLRQSLETISEVESQDNVVMSLANVAVVAAASGQPGLAIRLFAVEEHVRSAVGGPRALPERVAYEHAYS